MSDDFRWKMPDPTTVRTPTGQEITLAPERTDPRVHIGTSARNTFYWAQDRGEVERVCRERPDEIIVIGESYDMTGSQFLEYLADMTHDTSMLGTRFG